MKIAILWATLACTAAAQQTWSGLRFGMKMAEAQEVVKGAKLVDSDPAVRMLEAPAMVRAHDGSARLIFEKDSLIRVGLVFEQSRGKRCSEITPDEVVSAERLQQDLQDALREKYGQPVSTDRRSTLWKDGGQVIRFSSMSVCAGSITVTIIYEPVGKDNI